MHQFQKDVFFWLIIKYSNVISRWATIGRYDLFEFSRIIYRILICWSVK